MEKQASGGKKFGYIVSMLVNAPSFMFLTIFQLGISLTYYPPLKDAYGQFDYL